MRLSRVAGNRAIHRLLSSHAVQPKLRVGPVDDQYEREADRVADRVMRMADPGPLGSTERTPPGVQRLCHECAEEEKDEEEKSIQRVPAGVQRRCAQCEREESETSGFGISQ